MSDKYFAIYARYGGKYKEGFPTKKEAADFIEWSEYAGEIYGIAIVKADTKEVVYKGDMVTDSQVEKSIQFVFID